MKKYLLIAFLASVSLSSFAAEKQVNLHIEEMNCQLCVYLVNKELRAIDGVISTKGNIKSRLMSVVADDKVSNDQLVNAVGKLHYTAAVQE
ncbi:hypothetical protein A4G18_02855 [Pasteurellaceae bacterium Pebbles2]|nr:hypothetical protein [Pasteurellaceae bacterium Pebbles2]